MKIEDLGNEVDALFEEDSVFAQAVVDLQNRKKKLPTEKNKTENNISSEDNPSNIADDSATAENTSSKDAKDTSLPLENESHVFSGEITSNKDAGSDISLFEAEALAVDPADVISYREEESNAESAPKHKKSKLFGKRKKANPEPVKLLDFVINENNVSHKADDTSEEVQTDDKNKDSVNLEIVESISPATDSVKADTGDSAKGLTESIEEIIPEPDEETSLPETAEMSTLYVTKAGNPDDDSENTDIISTGPLSFDEDNSIILAQFDTQSFNTEDESEEDDDEDVSTTECLENEDTAKDSEVLSVNDDIGEKAENVEKAHKKAAEKSRFIDNVFDFVELFIFSLAAVLIITTFFFRHSVVDGSSMEKTLFHGEHIIVSKLFYEPERGDIIVCEDYSVYDKPLVKRIIGIPGDTVKVVNDFWGDTTRVYVNGEELKEDYIYLDGPDFPLDKTWIVGDDEVFVMGDHRNVSKDSRELGTIKIDSIIGKALIRFYPFDNFGKIE